MKKIVNIVFYKYFNEEGKQKQACIFYDDGTVAQVSYEEGIDACEEIVAEKNITSKDAFKEMINKDIVHVMSGKEFERRFSEFFVKNTEDSLENNQTPTVYQKRKQTPVVENQEENKNDSNDPIIVPNQQEQEVPIITPDNYDTDEYEYGETEMPHTDENDNVQTQSDDELPEDFISDEEVENNRDNRETRNIPPITPRNQNETDQEQPVPADTNDDASHEDNNDADA